MNSVIDILRKTRNGLRRSYYSIGSARACPICKWSGHSFIERAYSHKPGATHLCPSCGSSERHRFAYVSLFNKINVYSESVLHFAPEKCIEPWLRSVAKQYLSVDLNSPTVMQNMDIKALRIQNKSHSMVWCSHVLEHIDDDKKAMAEIYRVLRDNGVAVIMVPVYGDATYEDSNITSPQERLQHFKQEDHVRLYGLDIKVRLESVGFSVEILSVTSRPGEEVEKYALDYPSTREIFLCTKLDDKV